MTIKDLAGGTQEETDAILDESVGILEASETSGNTSCASYHTSCATNEPFMIIKDVSDVTEVYLGHTKVLFESMKEKTDAIIGAPVCIPEASETFDIDFGASEEIPVVNNEISVPFLDEKSSILRPSIQ